MIYKIKQCKYCGFIFSNIEGRSFSNHVRWCKFNATNGDKGKLNISKSSTLKKIKVIKKCIKCGNEFEIIRKIDKNGFERISKHETEHCSKKCANGRKHSDKTKRKISDKLKKPYYCIKCNKQIRKNKTGLCFECLIKNKKERWSQLQLYRSKCVFKFNIFKYPEDFDLNLIKKFGIYSAANRGNNLNGVSRDHKISVHDGFINNIDPNIISHPANCQLLRHNDNIKKNKKSDMSIDELKNKIKIWDEKHK